MATPKVSLTLSMSVELDTVLQRAAAARGKHKATFVRDLVIEHLRPYMGDTEPRRPLTPGFYRGPDLELAE